MEQRINATAARRQFGRVLQEVVKNDSAFVIESRGEAVAAIVPVRILQSWQRKREAFFEDMRATAERANLSEEEADKIVTEAIQRVRAEQPAGN